MHDEVCPVFLVERSLSMACVVMGKSNQSQAAIPGGFLLSKNKKEYMKEVRQKIGEMYQTVRERLHESDEHERVKRVSAHPHTPECTQSKDIELFNKMYGGQIGHGAFDLSMTYLDSYASRCQECGTEDHTHEQEGKRQ